MALARRVGAATVGGAAAAAYEPLNRLAAASSLCPRLAWRMVRASGTPLAGLLLAAVEPAAMAAQGGAKGSALATAVLEAAPLVDVARAIVAAPDLAPRFEAWARTKLTPGAINANDELPGLLARSAPLLRMVLEQWVSAGARGGPHVQAACLRILAMAHLTADTVAEIAMPMLSRAHARAAGGDQRLRSTHGALCEQQRHRRAPGQVRTQPDRALGSACLGRCFAPSAAWPPGCLAAWLAAPPRFLRPADGQG
ncbi:MAG: hypothetical protein J3K34DRAFT_412283 [Monoraphidium minutum]|nr:MAG: hypothetical protein J3K34DRAFT_446347 [Monoraphidium minutum]KAI8473121.1 MAG: hypothetical protein J3K34DRAFT_412283 [Monoraphidium minutum]